MRNLLRVRVGDYVDGRCGLAPERLENATERNLSSAHQILLYITGQLNC